MEVIKRNGKLEKVSFDKITKRLANFCDDLSESVDPIVIAQETIKGLFNRITTQELDLLSADICANKIHHHPDFNKLSSRILISNLHKSTDDNYYNVTKVLYEHKLLSKEFFEFVEKNKEGLQILLDYSRDYLFDYFGFKTLERSYLYKIYIDGKPKIIERPQHMWMRVAIQIHGLIDSEDNLEKLVNIQNTYTGLSNQYFTHATPTLFNSGSPRPQLSSCFLMTCYDDLENIFKNVTNISQISKYAGGIGISLTNIRSKGSIIHSTNGKSEGIIPFCKVLESVARYVTQGGKRNGSIACYIEPWHADIFEFVELRRNIGDENLRTRDLFLAIYANDIFMQRVMDDGMWSLMCPDECKGLVDSYGEEFTKLYTQYENEHKYKRQVKARDLWKNILEMQIETGMPYLIYKDHLNRKNSHKNLGTVTCSNLCVAPETKVLTSKGYFPIVDIANTEVDVWNGTEWSTVIPTKTGEDQHLIEVHFNNGEVLECTEYHKFYILDDLRIVEKRANQLEENDLIMSYNLPVITEGFKLLYPYTSGYLFSNKSMSLEIKTKPEILHKMLLENSVSKYNDNDTNVWIKLKQFDYYNDVPINACLNSKIRWLEGIIDSGFGEISTISNKKTLRIISKNSKNIRYLLNTIGCDCKIDGDILTIDSFYLHKLQNYSFNPITFDISQKIHMLNPEHVIVKQVIDNNRYSDTYCFKESLKHMGVFNGILTGQCAEITLYSNKDETAVCNLASICLPKFVNTDGTYDFVKLGEITEIVTHNLNKVIDCNFYPIPETKISNLRHRPIGIGIQGLADVYCKMGYAFESDKAFELNKKIFECIYYHSLKASCELAKKYGPYDSYDGSPFSQGFMQFDMWDKKIDNSNFNWDKLREQIRKYGLRNSHLTALMPTASTSQIMGNSECFEPITSNIYVRKTLAGEFIIVNEHLVRDLIKIGLWNKLMYEEILFNNGSVQNIDNIPSDIKEKYKTAFEIKGVNILKQAIDRGPFIDQTQSMNIFMSTPSFDKLNSSHFYGWKNGLKTGMYYLRTQPAVDAIKFGISPESIKKFKEKQTSKGEVLACTYVRKGQKPPEDCVVCSS